MASRGLSPLLALEISEPGSSQFLADYGRSAPFSVTSPKNLSGHMSDRGHMCGRPRPLASHKRGRFGKRHDRYGNLLHVLGSDWGHSCVVFCPLGDRDFLDLLRLFRTGPRSTVRVLVPMTPTAPLRASQWVRRGDREGLGQWLQRHSLQAFASRAACWHEGEWCHKRDKHPHMWL